MKKKIISILLASAMICSFVSGCGSKQEPDETILAETVTESETETDTEDLTDVESAAEKFLEAYKSYDAESLREACDSSTFDTMGIDENKSEEIKSSLLSSLDLSGTASQEIESAASEFARQVVEGEVRDFEIDDAVIEDGTGYVTAFLDHGPTQEAVERMDVSDKFQEAAANYSNEHMDELVEIYNSEGEEAFQNTLLDRIFPVLLNVMSEELNAVDSVKYEAALTLTMQDNGTWLVTGFFENPISTVSGSSSEAASPESAAGESGETTTEATTSAAEE